jgi:hypothetical protein
MAGLVTAEKHVIANPADNYGYTAEQRALAASIRSVVVVADRAEADVVAAAMATDGRPVTDANPLYVHRLDNGRIEVKTAGGWGGAPAGIQAYTHSVTNSGQITTVQVVKNIPTFTFVAGRSYRITAEGPYYLSGTGSTFAWQFTSCSTADPAAQTTGLTEMMNDTDSVSAASEGRRFKMSRVVNQAATQTLQLKLTCQRVTGSAYAIAAGSAVNPIFMAVEDLGATQGVV